ncbi:MAG TPA: SDR family oxidoreductase [Porticoccaceae bacterium]|jgi:NAD(P)-dependent dehydrogenase (short-subunit alcohol dehydrogenase family)|nr:SDR family oxidoreductase [Gammaproteobacteria bacterium]HIL59747.1 SDR family oxidoreductase [Porticoccaceae bacterium]
MSNPVCLIVGAGDYIGAAIARRFAAGGYTVCLGRRNGEKSAALVKEISDSGGQAHGFTLDAREETQIEERFAMIENEIGPLEIVISNPGGNVNFPIRETTERVFYKVWKMACLTGFLSGREAAKYMVPRNKGTILFTGATASIRGGSGFGAFASAKFALRGLAQSMARELGPQNIHVAHLIIDAGVDTAFVKERLEARGINRDELPEDTLMNPKSVGEAYWMLHNQTRDAWTHEMDLRPFAEKF